MSRRKSRTLDDRGASEVAGYILLVGLVLTATGVAVVMGSEAIGGFQTENEAAAAETILENIDSRLTTLTASSDAPTADFDFSSAAGQQLTVRRGGSLNVTIVSATGSACSAVATLGSVRYQESDRVVAYEGGGIWSGTTDGGSAMLSPPDVSFRDGSLDVSLVNVTGAVQGGRTEASVDRAATRNNNTRHRSNLQACESVDEVQVTVNSTFYEAWGEYLSEQTGVSTTKVGAKSVRVTLTSSDLPVRADMENNTVVNVSNPGYMTAGPGAGFVDGPKTLTVEKGPSDNSYLVSAEALTQQPPQISQVQELSADNVSDRQRAPVDVVFVMDESGSMGGQKIQDAREAAKAAVGSMNTSVIGDRASIIGYEPYPNQRYVVQNGQNAYFSNDSTELNNTIDTLSAGGSTDISAGLNQSLAALSYRETNRDAFVILLTDGRNEPGGKCNRYDSQPGYFNCQQYFDDRTLKGAQIAANRDVTVHTFSFGTGADQSLLEDVADITGGNHTHAANGDELEEAFRATVGGFTSRRDYATRTPLTTNFTGGNQVHPPQIVGDTDPLANTTGGGGSVFFNINDPTAPTLFSHSFRVDDGDPVVINATKFDCADDGWADTGSAVQVGGRTLPVARCTEIVSTNETLDDSRIEFYYDGQTIPQKLYTNDDINDTLEQYNGSTTSTPKFDLASNEIVINLNFERQGEFENNLILLYEIGLSEAEVNGADVVNLQETVIDLD